jgi:hypothetical protein
VPWVALNRGQGLQITRIGELVQVDHDFVATGQPVQHKVATNKPGSAGHQDRHASLSKVSIFACGKDRTMVKLNILSKPAQPPIEPYGIKTLS